VSALRFISRRNLLEQPGRVAACTTFDGLFEHPTPFDVEVRFPERVFCMSRINNKLLRLEATAGDGPFAWRDSRNMVPVCAKVMQAVAQTIGIATSVLAEAEKGHLKHDQLCGCSSAQPRHAAATWPVVSASDSFCHCPPPPRPTPAARPLRPRLPPRCLAVLLLATGSPPPHP
jgi:hypothetical protein